MAYNKPRHGSFAPCALTLTLFAKIMGNSKSSRTYSIKVFLFVTCLSLVWHYFQIFWSNNEVVQSWDLSTKLSSGIFYIIAGPFAVFSRANFPYSLSEFFEWSVLALILIGCILAPTWRYNVFTKICVWPASIIWNFLGIAVMTIDV